MSTLVRQYAAFAELAKQYCDLAADTSIGGWPGLKVLHAVLIRLHAAAIELVDVDLPQIKDRAPFERDITHEEFWAFYQSLQTRLPLDLYWDTFNPLDEPPESSVAGSLADDLADIWRDLENGHRLLNANRSPEDVWWEWRFSFHTHWGQHSADALRVMYYALRDNS